MKAYKIIRIVLAISVMAWCGNCYAAQKKGDDKDEMRKKYEREEAAQRKELANEERALQIYETKLNYLKKRQIEKDSEFTKMQTEEDIQNLKRKIAALNQKKQQAQDRLDEIIRRSKARQAME